MQWNEGKNVLLMREILEKSVPVHKQISQERGQGWQNVSGTLNSLWSIIWSRYKRSHNEFD